MWRGEWREGGNLNLAALRQQSRIEDREDIAARGKEGPHLYQQNIHLTAKLEIGLKIVFFSVVES